MSAMVIWWVLIVADAYKFGMDQTIAGYSTQQECVEAGQRSARWGVDWSCFTVAMPVGQPFVWVNDGHLNQIERGANPK